MIANGLISETGEGEEEPVRIEQGDEGEVLLLKIHRLKEELEDYDKVKELRFYEEQLKASTSQDGFSQYMASSMEKERQKIAAASNRRDANPERKKNPSLADATGVPNKVKSNDVDAYELLEEKHRLSGSSSLAASAPDFVPGNTSALISRTSSGMTEETHAMTEGTTSSCMTSLASPQTSRDDLSTSKKLARFPLPPTSREDYTSGSTKDLKARLAAPQDTDTNPTDLENGGERTSSGTPRLQRGQRLREGSTPGAVSILGVDSSIISTHVRQVSDIQEDITSNEEQPRDGDMLIEAKVVDDVNEQIVNAPFVTAKRDPWYRRNQWWLAGAAILVAAAIILSVTLTTMNRNSVAAPTMSPTTQLEGAEFNTEALILTSFPAAVTSLSEEASSQAKALRWISKRRLDDPSSFSETRTLQQYALVTFFFSTLGDSSWVQKQGWLNGTDECTWYGVECTSNNDVDEKLVIRLSLSENNISGTIPSDLSILSSGLRALDLSNNRLGGSIPAAFGLLSLLNTVSFSSNRLDGTIPASIQNLINLEHLHFSLNRFTGFIPSEIGSLTMLQTIDVAQNLLVEDIPSEMGRLTHLGFLSFEDNKLSSPIPSEVGFLTGLDIFKASGNSLLGPLPSEIGSLRSLRTLDLSKNLVFGTIPNQVSLLTNLTSLDLASNLLTGTVPQNLGLLNLLTSLSFYDNNLYDILPASIGLITDLLHLDMSGNVIFDERPLYDTPGLSVAGVRSTIPTEVAWLRNLISLDLGGMYFDVDDSPVWLSALTNLEVLRLAGSNIGDAFEASSTTVFPEIMATLVSLREIDLSDNHIRGSIPTELGLLSQLEVLNLEANSFVGQLNTNIGLLSNLSVLNMGENFVVGGIPEEFFNLSSLTDLNLRSYPSALYGMDVLSGTISTSIGRLKNLKHFDATFSAISGTIPSEIGLLELMEDLQLGATKITGWIPTEIELLTGLRSLDVHETAVSGLVPEIDTRFETLEMLDLSATLLTGSVPSGLWSLSKLTFLHLSTSGISASIPSELGVLSKLSSFTLAGPNANGSTIPPQIGQLSNLHRLDLMGASLSGSIPSEVFQCTKLTSLRLGGRTHSGTLPSEIGLVSNLLQLQISNAPITGGIPTEIGNLELLTSLDLSYLDIDGTIPTELSRRLLFLENLDLAYTQLSGFIPTYLQGLSNLEKLSFAGIDHAGSQIPSEIALLLQLSDLDLSYSNIGGTIPTELVNLEQLIWTDIRGNDITGSFPSEMCGLLHVQQSSTFSYTTDRVAYIDCGELNCTCCECAPTVAPSISLSPSFTPSTRTPSVSTSPSDAPSLSVPPSISTSPTLSTKCSPFTPIADIGTDIFPSGVTDEGLFAISLPFPFNWRGQIEYTSVTISPNGVMFLGNMTSPLYDGNAAYTPIFCCGSYPVGQYEESGVVRIAIAQEDLIFLEPASAYITTVGDAFVISFEGAEFYSHQSITQNLNFQVALYANGNVEMRWGDSSIDSLVTIAAGLEDGPLATPATGAPFDDFGVTEGASWPTNQCRLFETTPDGNYTEYLF